MGISLFLGLDTYGTIEADIAGSTGGDFNLKSMALLATNEKPIAQLT